MHTLPVRVLREVVKMSSAFPRPTISAANGCAIIAAFPLNRLHNRMRPIDADRVYTSTGHVALTILLQNGDPMLIVELTRLLLHWLWYYIKYRQVSKYICFPLPHPMFVLYRGVSQFSCLCSSLTPYVGGV